MLKWFIAIDTLVALVALCFGLQLAICKHMTFPLIVLLIEAVGIMLMVWATIKVWRDD